MKRYRDWLGKTYEVSDEQAERFERRRGVCLKIEVIIKIILLAVLLYLFW